MTLTPPWAITHTHMDYYGCNQYMVHLFGHKIWLLLWPPTEKNLAIFGLHYMQLPNSDTTLSCIQELEGLQVFYAREYLGLNATERQEVTPSHEMVFEFCLELPWIWNSLVKKKALDEVEIILSEVFKQFGLKEKSLREAKIRLLYIFIFFCSALYTHSFLLYNLFVILQPYMSLIKVKLY